MPRREASVLLTSLAKGLAFSGGYDVNVMVMKLISSIAATINRRSLFTLSVTIIVII